MRANKKNLFPTLDLPAEVLTEADKLVWLKK
jgi:hypothetical protein